MARARLISRDFFTSADLTDLPAPARLLFAGLIVYADDAGIIRHHPRFFQRTILQGLRISLTAIEQWLDMLRTRNVLAPRKLEGVSCWKITNFAAFQRLKRREGKRRDDDDEAVAVSTQPETPKPEPENHSAADVLEALAYQPPFLLGEPKAHAAIARLALTLEDVEAWKAAPMTDRRRVWGIQRFKTPADLERHVERLKAEDRDDASLERSAESRVDAVRAKREAARREEEAEHDAEAVPPPAEFLKAIQGLAGDVPAAAPVRSKHEALASIRRMREAGGTP